MGEGADFDGGRLVFHDADADRVVLPQPGMLVAFESGAANLHAVQRVTAGTRFALTMWLTRHAEPADSPSDPTHLAMQAWAASVESSTPGGLPSLPSPPPSMPPMPSPPMPPPPMPPSPLAARLPSYDEALVSAAICSLPANDSLGRALLIANGRGGTSLGQTLALGLGVSAEEACAAPPPSAALDRRLREGADATASAAPLPHLPACLEARAAALDALATTLLRARAARAPQQLALAPHGRQPEGLADPNMGMHGGSTGAPLEGKTSAATAAAADAFSVFDF